jgi:hypothetical protein
MAEPIWRFPVSVEPEQLAAILRAGTALEHTHGHRLGPWRAPSEEVATDTDLIFNSFERCCACGVGLLAGCDGRGHFQLMAGYDGDYGRWGEQTGYQYKPYGAEAQERVFGRCPLAAVPA